MPNQPTEPSDPTTSSAPPPTSQAEVETGTVRHTPPAAATRWAEATGGEAGEDYARRIAAATEAARAQGKDVHGEARFVHDLGGPQARVLDAGCGTGRVAIALADMGHAVLGVDADLSMLRVAADAAPKIPFWLSDLAELDVPQAAIAGGFDVVVMAGNVVPYLAEGSLPAVLMELARVTKRGGHVVAGFGIDPADLPAGLPVTELAEYDAAAAAAGLEQVGRYAGWDREPFTPEATYAVSVHRLHTPPPPPASQADGDGPDAADAAGHAHEGQTRRSGLRGLFRRR